MTKMNVVKSSAIHAVGSVNSAFAIKFCGYTRKDGSVAVGKTYVYTDVPVIIRKRVSRSTSQHRKCFFGINPKSGKRSIPRKDIPYTTI